MHKEPPNDISAKSCLVPASIASFMTGENIRLKQQLLRVFLFVLLYKILGFSIERLALATGIDRPCLAKAFKSTSWVVAQCNL